MATYLKMNCNKERIQERQEFGKARLCRRSQADSVTRLGCNGYASESFSICAAPSHSCFVKTPELKRLCFYKHSSGYFIFFPASGYRHNSNGTLGNSGTNGYGWTSVPNGSNAWNLYFNSGNAYMNNNNNRTNGFPVRCVQASAPVFALFFPASGYRYNSNGTLNYSGTSGYGWTSVPNSGSAWRLNFYSGNASMGNDGRTYGFPVRCVQASAPIIAFLQKDIKQIRYRRESGKASLCRRGRADSVTRLKHKLSASRYSLSCAALSYLNPFIKIPVLKRPCFYKHSSGYFIFFPASGLRNNSNGTLSNSGSNGYVWSSVPNSSNAYNLYFNSGNAYVNNNNRNNGFTVRCVQASAAVFAFYCYEYSFINDSLCYWKTFLPLTTTPGAISGIRKASFCSR